MSNKIQIKRSVANSTVTGLSNGELAFTQASNTLHIGLPDGSGVLRIGGAQYPGTLTNSHALVANATGGIDKVIVANLQPIYIYANGASGTNGQFLTSNSTGGVYWLTPDASVAGSNTQVQFNDSGSLAGDADLTYDKTNGTLTANNFSGNGALVTSVNAAAVGGNTASTLRTYSDTVAGTAYSNAVSTAATDATNKAANAYSNATSYADTAAGTAYSNATSYADTAAGTAYSNAVSTAATDATGKAANAYSNAMSDTLSRNGTYTGNNTLAGTTTTVSSNLVLSGLASSNVIPSANLTYHLGNTTNRWVQVHAGNGHFVTGTFDDDVQIAGNLTVTGNVTTTNVNDLIVGDPLIHLAANNESSDVVDIGFVGHYSDDGGSTKKHIGFFRDASDGGVFKLFTGSQDATLDAANSVVVNVSATGYTTAILEAYLRSSGLVSNSSVVNITANSTVSVALTANTLTLTTALAGTSGGTGKSTMTDQAILVGNSSNGYDELTLGTDGYVLQSNGTALLFDVLDGGTF